MRRFKYRQITLALCLAFSLSSCGKSSKDARKPNWLYLNFSHEPATADVRKTTETTAALLSYLTREGLLRLSSSGELELAQAERVEISPDRKTYTFFLKKTYWSNGEPLLAKDFANSWLSILDPKTGSPNAYFFFCIKNAKAAYQGEVPKETIGIEVKDDHCLTVHLEEPIFDFLQIVASRFALPMKYKDDTLNLESLLFNGPFIIKTWTHAKEIELVQNPFFRAPKQIGIEGILISLIEHEASSVALFQQGLLDMVGYPYSFIPHSVENGLFEAKDAQMRPGSTVSVCVFNTTQFPLNNLSLRKALCYAIDREMLAQSMNIFYAHPAYSLIPSCVLDHPKDAIFNHDKQTAKEFLKLALQELGTDLEHLPKITLTYPLSQENGAIQKIVQILQFQWREHLGIDVGLEALEIKLALSKFGSKTYDVGFVTWDAYWDSPFCCLDRFLSKNNKKNYSNWENSTFTKLVYDARITEEKESRSAKFLEAEKLLIEDAPILPVIVWDYHMIQNPRMPNPIRQLKNGSIGLEVSSKELSQSE